MSTILGTDLTTLDTAQLIAIIENMARANRAKITMKVSEKGALSMYGFGQWPVTLYKSQWLRLLEAADDIQAFIKANAHALTEKPAK